MRRLPALLLLITAIVAVAACAGGAPGWTYAPAASATPAASGGASAEPSGGASAAPSGAPSTAPSVAPSVGPSAAPSSEASGGTGTTLTVTAPVGAAGTGFDPKTLETAANAAFTIHFDNQDNQPHNVQVKGPSGEVALGGDTKFFQGPGTRDYAVPALPAGEYTYYCVVHPTSMLGTLEVK